MVPKALSTCALTLCLLAPAAWAAPRVELLDFYLTTCAPCRAMSPTVDRLEAEGVAVRRVDAQREPALAERLRVDSFPTFVALIDGEEAGRIVGATSYEALKQLVGGAAEGSQQPFASRGPVAQFASSQTNTSTATAPVASSVRLTMEDAQSRSYGTGTIIDSRQGEALVVTCAHLFRGEGNQPLDVEGKLSVEIYEDTPAGPRVVDRVPGQLISHDFESDVALVAIRPRGAVTAARVAAADVRQGDSAASIGCDLGADPSVRQHQIVSLNRYQGPANTEATGAPVQGRSGGGLFNTAGELVGVCFAADEEANEGLYAGLAAVHAELDRLGLGELYKGVAAPVALASAAGASAPPLDPFSGRPSSEQPAPGGLAPVVRGQSPDEDALGALAPVERATLEEIGARVASGEVTLLLRSDEPGAKTEVVTVPASAELMEVLRRIGRTASADTPAMR
ncbi:MAG: trypsin-like peptidase domain-containing protein [Lacipirellulaceae bacterium]